MGIIIFANKQMWFQEAAPFECGSALKQWARASSTSWVPFPCIIREWLLSSTWKADQKTFSWLWHKLGQCWHVQESELRLWSGCSAKVFQVVLSFFQADCEHMEPFESFYMISYSLIDYSSFVIIFRGEGSSPHVSTPSLALDNAGDEMLDSPMPFQFTPGRNFFQSNFTVYTIFSKKNVFWLEYGSLKYLNSWLFYVGNF